jgi:hypothetical protein
MTVMDVTAVHRWASVTVYLDGLQRAMCEVHREREKKSIEKKTTVSE